MYMYQNLMYVSRKLCMEMTEGMIDKHKKPVKIFQEKNIPYFFNGCQLPICVATDYNAPVCTFYIKTCLSSHISQRPLIINILVTRVQWNYNVMHCRLKKVFIKFNINIVSMFLPILCNIFYVLAFPTPQHVSDC